MNDSTIAFKNIHAEMRKIWLLQPNTVNTATMRQSVTLVKTADFKGTAVKYVQHLQNKPTLKYSV